MNLYLRKVVHPQAHDNYRVILKRDGDEVEIGSTAVSQITVVGAVTGYHACPLRRRP